MFDSKNNETFAAINELCSLSKESKKPIVIWVGAGASAWCELPLWSQLADNFHKDYCRYESAYDRKRAGEFLSQISFPDFFSYCKQISSVRFNNLLVSSLKAPENPPPVYARFISALKATKQPLQILTTNVDEALEQNLHLPVILPADLERLKTLVQNRESFIAKLHGSISWQLQH
jgi:NAD-dependent SIR2 family protein deacetylase